MFPSKKKDEEKVRNEEKKRRPTDFKGQTKKAKDSPVKLFEVNEKVGLTSATVSLTLR